MDSFAPSQAVRRMPYSSRMQRCVGDTMFGAFGRTNDLGAVGVPLMLIADAEGEKETERAITALRESAQCTTAQRTSTTCSSTLTLTLHNAGEMNHP